MKRFIPLAMLGVGITVCSIGALFLWSQQKNEKPVALMNTEETQELAPAESDYKPENIPTASNEATQSEQMTRYQEFTPAIFEDNKDKRRVLFFYSSWCPTCRPAADNFQQNISMIPEDMVILRVNYNDPETDADETALAKKYQVTYQHTFLQIDADGNIVTQWNGGQINDLLAKIKE